MNKDPALGKPPLAPRHPAAGSAGTAGIRRRSEHLSSKESLLSDNTYPAAAPAGSRKDVAVLVNRGRGSVSSSSAHSPKESVIIDNTYISFERGVQDSLGALLNHIRNNLLQKEGQLREYQVDLLQRERTIQENEQDIVVRIRSLEQSEKSLRNKRERLQMYKDSMMYQLEAKAKQLAKFEKRLQWNNDVTDSGLPNQNESSSTNNSSAQQHSNQPALPPRHPRDTSWANRNTGYEHMNGDIHPQREANGTHLHMNGDIPSSQREALGGFHGRSSSGAIVNDGQTSYNPNAQRYPYGSNVQSYRISFTGPSSNSSYQANNPNQSSVLANHSRDERTNNTANTGDWGWNKGQTVTNPNKISSGGANPISVPKTKHHNPTTNQAQINSIPQTNSEIPSNQQAPTRDQSGSGVLHVDTGYYSIREGEQRRSNSHGSNFTHHTSTSSLLQVDDERWKQQQDHSQPNPSGQSHNLSHQQHNAHPTSQAQVISHEQLDRRYYPERRSYDLSHQPPMKESPRQAWQRSRNKFGENNSTSQQYVGQSQQTQNQSYQKPSYAIPERQQFGQKSWNSSPNMLNASYDELPESHRLNSSHDAILEPEGIRNSRDSMLDRQLSTTDIQVVSPSSPPPAYNGQSGPPLPSSYAHPPPKPCNHVPPPTAYRDPPSGAAQPPGLKGYTTSTVIVNGYSPQGSSEEASHTANYRDRYPPRDYPRDYNYQSRDRGHYSPGSRVHFQDEIAPRHQRRVTEL